MAGIWWHSSTFTHCLLMVPMIGWLVSQRVALLRPPTPVFWWPALVWMAGAGLTWLVGQAAGVGLFRPRGLNLMLQGAVGRAAGDRKSAVEGKGGSVRVELGGLRHIKK